MQRIHTDLLPELLKLQEQLFDHIANNSNTKSKNNTLKRFQTLGDLIWTWQKDKLFIGTYVIEAICLASHFHKELLQVIDTDKEKQALEELTKVLDYFEQLLGNTFKLAA